MYNTLKFTSTYICTKNIDDEVSEIFKSFIVSSIHVL